VARSPRNTMLPRVMASVSATSYSAGESRTAPEGWHRGRLEFGGGGRGNGDAPSAVSGEREIHDAVAAGIGLVVALMIGAEINPLALGLGAQERRYEKHE
jgi:hypothetical protein